MTIQATAAAFEPKAAKTKRNWWKVAFFVALLAFEMAREWAVIASAEEAQPSAVGMVFGSGDYIAARGRWKRIDGGDRLVPSTVTIQCRREMALCIESSVSINDRYVSAPEVELFTAQFTPDAVTYENDSPECARYSVSIDLKLKKAIAVRERKLSRTNARCVTLEPRIEMQLSDGYDPDDSKFDEHFVPMMQLIVALAKLG